MASIAPELVFDRTFGAEPGVMVEIAPGIARVTAPNASAYTFTGTNSYLLGTHDLILVDPGPDLVQHLTALATAVGERRVLAIVLTHTHKDHSALARQAATRFNAPIWFAGRHRRSRKRRLLEIDPIAKSCDWALRPDIALVDGDKLAAGDLQIEVIATPGHCANHIALGLSGTPYILTGDHVMGWNSTLVAVPDGSMRDYFNSLDRVIAAPYSHYLPGHGGPIVDGPAYTRALKAHREMRNRQILEILTEGPAKIAKLLDGIYPQYRGVSRFAAGMTLNAHLEYLAQRGEILLYHGLFKNRAQLV